MNRPAPTVLVADDNRSVANLIEIVLRRSGCEVIAAVDGIDASVLLDAKPFDVLITDLDMPGRSGLEVIADALRLQPGIQTVLMSGEWFVGGSDVRQIARRLGVRHFLSKPFPLHEVLLIFEACKGSTDCSVDEKASRVA